MLRRAAVGSLRRTWFRSAALAIAFGGLFATLAARAEGVSTDDKLFSEASARIEQNRKTDAVVVVVDRTGKPVPAANVSIEQTRHAFLFGCNLFLWGRVGGAKEETAYRSQFADLFNYATLPFFWNTYEPKRGQTDHVRLEDMARWCRAHGITCQGAPLAWNYTDPAWLPNDPNEIRALQLADIDNCVSRFKGLVSVWEVVNEATGFERPAFKKRAPKLSSMWEQTGQIEFVKECFRQARSANPSATLLINDYRTDPAYAAVLAKVLASSRQRPFDAIGLQSHMHRGAWSNTKLWNICQDYAKFSVPLHFTETTLLSGTNGWGLAVNGHAWPSTPEGEKRQADEIERVYTILFSHPAVTAITWWDFSDLHAWQDAPAGLVRADMSAKPGYLRLRDLVKNRWWTRTKITTDADGKARFRGFLGEYEITVRVPPDGKAVANMTLDKRSANILTVKLP